MQQKNNEQFVNLINGNISKEETRIWSPSDMKKLDTSISKVF